MRYIEERFSNREGVYATGRISHEGIGKGGWLSLPLTVIGCNFLSEDDSQQCDEDRQIECQPSSQLAESLVDTSNSIESEAVECREVRRGII